MNSIYANTVKKEIKGGLIILAVFLCLLSVVLFLQSIKFASSLWVLLEFGYGEWKKYLLSMLDSLVIWAILTGIIFSIQFFISSPGNNLKKILSRTVIGFVTGFIFTYLLVLAIGIILYIPLGTISIFLPGIIKFATLEFAWLVAAYIIFIFIIVDAPRMLFYAISKGNWYFKLMGILVAFWLGIQILKAFVVGILIILENSIWQTNIALVAIGLSLIMTVIINILSIRHEAITKIIFAVIIVYIASLITGNVAFGVFHWGEIPSLILASFVGPIAYSFAAKIIIHYGINAVLNIFGMVGGISIGLLIDYYTKLRIVGQGWFGILCGTVLTIGFGIAFGLWFGSTLSNFLIDKMKINSLAGFWIFVGLFLGIITGMVFGGFLAR
jgi:hypothetical protein